MSDEKVCGSQSVFHSDFVIHNSCHDGVWAGRGGCEWPIWEDGDRDPCSETICSIAKGELQKKRENPEGNKGSPQNRWGIQLDEIEQDMIARITMLEAGAEPDRGQQAVVEVILNRMYSDQFPDTVYEVLSQKDNGCSQFVTWKNRNMDAAKPSERVKRNVKAVLDGETHILPLRPCIFPWKRKMDIYSA